MSSFMSLRHPAAILAAAVLDDPECVVTGCQDGVLRVWSSSAWHCVQELPGHARAVLAITHSSGLLYSAGADTTIRIWDTLGGLQRHDGGGGFTCIAALRVGAGIIYSLVASPTPHPHAPRATNGGELPAPRAGRHLSIFAGCQNTRVFRIDVEVGERRGADGSRRGVAVLGNAAFHGHTGFVYSLLVHRGPSPASSAWLCAGSGDGSIKLFPAWPAAVAPGANGAPALAADASASGGGVAAMAVASGEGCCDSDDGALPRVTLPPQSAVQELAVGPPLTSTAPVAVLRCSPATPSPSRASRHSGGAAGGGAEAVAAAAAAALIDADVALHKWETCGAINALIAFGRDLYAGSQDGVIRVWEVDAAAHLKYEGRCWRSRFAPTPRCRRRCILGRGRRVPPWTRRPLPTEAPPPPF